MRRSMFFAALVLMSCGNPEPDRVRLYHTEPIGPGFEAAQVEGLDLLGPTLLDKGINFGVFSKNASRIDLLLFDDPEADRPTQQFEMVRQGDVWNLYVEGVGVGQHYGYVAWGPNWDYESSWRPGKIDGFVADVDAAGNRFNPNKLLIDPYGKAIHRDHDWSKGSLASGPDRTVSTYAAASKSVVIQSEYTWSENESQWREMRKADKPTAANEQIVYEVHAKGFTADPASGVDHPGTYRGIAEKAEYFADLGVTAVELLPIHEKPLDGGYWGYNNISFFAPEISYASTSDPREVIDEFKMMVDALHQQGVEVWVDVVYNHTGEGGLWREKIELNDTAFGSSEELINHDPYEVAGLYSFRGLDNAAYYALSADGRTYWNNTGVGNQTRSNNDAMRRLILDSLRFYVEELHVDGFRFDLAPVLAEKDQFYNEWDVLSETVVQDIANDPILNEYNTRLTAEPWSLQGFYLGQFPKADGTHAWSEWNAHFRDVWRSFVNDDNWALNRSEGSEDVGGALTGSFNLFGDDGRRPYHAANFITVHDGFTMYDLVSYNEKLNGCGPLNPVCCDSPNSAWCQKDTGESNNRSRDWGDEPTKRQMMRNFFVSMLVAHGTPLLLGGDEWMRTQLGNNNAYSTQADNQNNWFQWGGWQAKDENHRMHDFVRDMIKFRRDNLHAFAPADYGAGAPFEWKNASNTGEPDWGSRNLMMHYYDPTAGPELLVAINMQRDPVDFTLPEGRTWTRVVDTQAYFDDTAFLSENADDLRRSYNIDTDEPLVLTEPTYQAMGSSIVIFRAQ